MSVTRDEVLYAFRFLLGREPESETAIHAHLGAEDADDLGARIRCSNEFKNKIMHAQFSGTSKWVSTDVLGKFTQWLDLRDRFVSYGCLMNDWEPEETRFFRSIVNPGDVVLDIGANIGWFSLVAADCMNGMGTIHAFEPRPETSRMLARTIADNDLGAMIHLWKVALSDEPDLLILNWQSETDNPGGSFLSFGDQGETGAETAKVPAVALDDLLPDVTPTTVKIDVEGAEPRAIRGAARALARGKPTILSELYPKQLMNVSGCQAVDYIDLMKQMGYRCFELKDSAIGGELHDYPADTSRDLVSVVFQWLGR